jgi:hypothetical protein
LNDINQIDNEISEERAGTVINPLTGLVKADPNDAKLSRSEKIRRDRLLSKMMMNQAQEDTEDKDKKKQNEYFDKAIKILEDFVSVKLHTNKCSVMKRNMLVYGIPMRQF